MRSQASLPHHFFAQLDQERRYLNGTARGNCRLSPQQFCIANTDGIAIVFKDLTKNIQRLAMISRCLQSLSAQPERMIGKLCPFLKDIRI
ncbi:MAG: hypothetical protein IPK98_19425 [Chloracidobacterium sp.]|nr:hypothetical protein [Chloracidobacterium sp.]